jgi:hypothetical protein
MIDTGAAHWKMESIGREDRALLRSNPSARSDAGTWAGASRQGPPPPPLHVLALNAKNLGAEESCDCSPRTGVPYGNIFRAG